MSLLALQATDVAQSAAEGRLPLFGDYSLADPWSLALIPLALLVLLFGRGSHAREAGRVSVTPRGRLPVSPRQALIWLPPVLQLASLVLVIFALARPLRGDVETVAQGEGVDIALLVDVSSSMKETDLDESGRGRGERTRLDVVKDVVADFATRRMTDREGAADNVALFTFARYTKNLCPFTLDVDAVRGFLADVETISVRELDGTGIGIALAKSVAVLSETDADSKVVVLLTDGENNIELVEPAEAAELAAAEDIRVYTVFAARYATDPFGRKHELRGGPGMRELEHIAEVTGGRFFHARDRAGLEEAYATIEALERTPRLEERHVDHYDLYAEFLLWALVSYAASWLLASTWLRRLP